MEDIYPLGKALVLLSSTSTTVIPPALTSILQCMTMMECTPRVAKKVVPRLSTANPPDRVSLGPSAIPRPFSPFRPTFVEPEHEEN